MATQVSSSLQRRGGGHGLARTAQQREWLFSGGDELFRGIYTRANLGQSEILTVTSAIAGEGKSTLSVGLAVTVAQDFPDRNVLLVETDSQRPTMAEDFELEDGPGLVESLLANESIEGAIRPTFLDNLNLLPVGRSVDMPGRPLRSSRLMSILDGLREAYDLIILDIPAILVNSDAVVLVEIADGAIFVVRAGVTPSQLVNRALLQIEPTKLRGIVLNGAKSSVPGGLRRLGGA